MDEQQGALSSSLPFWVWTCAALPPLAAGVLGGWGLDHFFLNGPVEGGPACAFPSLWRTFAVWASFVWMSTLAVHSAVVLRVSHRVAGPLYRFERVGRHLRKRVLVGRIHLRKGDEGSATAACLNRWLERRRDRSNRLRSMGERLDQALQNCEAANRKSREDWTSAVDKLQQEMDQLLKQVVSSNS